jgi:hypothetical protein
MGIRGTGRHDGEIYADIDKAPGIADNSGKKPLDSVELFRFDPTKYEKRLFGNGNGPKDVNRRRPTPGDFTICWATSGNG